MEACSILTVATDELKGRLCCRGEAKRCPKIEKGVEIGWGGLCPRFVALSGTFPVPPNRPCLAGVTATCLRHRSWLLSVLQNPPWYLIQHPPSWTEALALSPLPRTCHPPLTSNPAFSHCVRMEDRRHLVVRYFYCSQVASYSEKKKFQCAANSNTILEHLFGFRAALQFEWQFYQIVRHC